VGWVYEWPVDDMVVLVVVAVDWCWCVGASGDSRIVCGEGWRMWSMKRWMAMFRSVMDDTVDSR
jgi:hypothetical protein